MITECRNPFVVGPVATGASLIGRKQELAQLSQSLFEGVSAINLIGPPRIGKTSLVSEVFARNEGRTNRMRIFFSMGNCEDAFDFWYTFWNELKCNVEGAGLWDDFFQRKFGELDALDGGEAHWYTKAKGVIRRILEKIGKLGYRVVLGIDEFDSASRLFGDKAEYYQLLRSIFSEPGWATSGIIISRRRLVMFESQCPYISTFHGVFREVPLRAFSPEDMKEFYCTLETCNVSLTESGKQRLTYYTGCIPYLCSMFASRMVIRNSGASPVNEGEVDNIFRECIPQVDSHYNSLIDRLQEDDHLEFLFYLSIDARLPSVTQRHFENMTTMGTLVQENGQYYAYSKDFMTFLRLKPLTMPAWETMTAAEKKLKSFFAREYPNACSITYSDLLADQEKIEKQVKETYPALKFDSRTWKTIEDYCRTLSTHKANPSVLDVLTLPQTIFYIKNEWNDRFSKYFGGDFNWKDKLEQIRKLRNPMAHAQLEYISSEEIALCMKYCDELIRL